jgi:hypothetical protein
MMGLIKQKSSIARLTAVALLVVGSLVNIQPVRAQEEPAGTEVVPPYCEGGLPDGFVKCVYNDGERQADRYEGQFVDGRPEGQGIYTYKNRDRYEGEFSNGLPNGQGTFIFADDGRVEGVFKDGNITSGQVIFTNGDRYVGEFRLVTIIDTGVTSSQPHGQGEFIYADGDRYSGTFFIGAPLGNGVLTRIDGTRCEGEFFNLELDGKATCTFSNGLRYEGELRNGVPHGEGVIIDANGKRFPGSFRAGKPTEAQ